MDWDAILTEVRDGLGLPPRARLRAEPHALLVYGKGQFFLPHAGLGEGRHDDRHAGGVAAVVAHRENSSSSTTTETVAYQASVTEVSVAAF